MKHECVCELCEHDHRWAIGAALCTFTHALETLAFGPNINDRGIALKHLLRQKEAELAALRAGKR